MLKNIKLAGCMLAAILSGSVSLKCASDYDPLTTEISYSSYSSRNSINKVFVTGEEIDVFVGLADNADRVYVEEERQNRDGIITNSYEMNNIGNKAYAYKLNEFNDASILCFRIKADRNGESSYSNKTCEPILTSKKDAFNITKNWLDSLNPTVWDKLVADYNINERIDYSNFSIEADFNLKKAGGIILNDYAIIEYVGENDEYIISSFEEEKLNEHGITNIYINPFYYLVESFPTPDDLTTKQDLENMVSDFYYSL